MEKVLIELQNTFLTIVKIKRMLLSVTIYQTIGTESTDI